MILARLGELGTSVEEGNKSIWSTWHVLPLAGVVLLIYVLIPRRRSKAATRLPLKSDEQYDGDEFPSVRTNLPVISGRWKIALFRGFSQTSLGKLITSKKSKANGVYNLRKIVIPEETTFLPMVPYNDVHTSGVATDPWTLIKPKEYSEHFHFNGISDLISAYRSGACTPTDVAKRLLACIKESDISNRPLRSYIEVHDEEVMQQAAASTERWKAGKPLSAIDGAFVGIKDEYIVGQHHCRNGSQVGGQEISKLEDEGYLLRTLRKEGAIIVGVTNMHEIGIGVSGINPSSYHGTQRNPYNLDTCTGGSSGGSASAVASGLATFALGTDGGGSIRVPSGCCGVVGLKATFDRFDHSGLAMSLTVSHTGPICSNVRDIALTYACLAGRKGEQTDRFGVPIPPVLLGDWESTDLTGLRVGVDDELNQEADEAMRAGIDKALRILADHGAEIVRVRIPEKAEIAYAHIVLILSEMASCYYADFKQRHNDMNVDSVSSLRMGRTFSAHDYLQAARQRTRAMNAMAYLFSHSIDVLISPVIDTFQVHLTPSMIAHGYLNLNRTANIVRFNTIGNLTGIPGLSMPIDYSKDNLPVPVQLQALWWREDLLIKMAHTLEKAVAKDKKKPELFFDVLQDSV